MAYIDKSFCFTQGGEDIVSIGDARVRIHLGVGSGKGCDALGHGILGMDRDSDLLKAMDDASQPSLFSFSFRDIFTGEGENLFTMGGLAGFKEDDIIWAHVHENSRGPRSELFEIDMPYIAYNGERFNFPRGHKVDIDTGSSITVLPGEVMERFWRVVSPKPSSPNLSEGEKPPTIPVQVYNLTGYAADQHPAMTFRLGDTEWILDIVDTSFGTEFEGSEVYVASVVPDSSFHQDDEPGSEISILGATFWSHLKGLVFDYTPGKERVGFVPRLRLTTKTGLLNPTFVSAGKRSWAGCIPLWSICGLTSFLLPSLII